MTFNKKLPKGTVKDKIEIVLQEKLTIIFLTFNYEFHLSSRFCFALFINIWNEIGPSFAWETAQTALHNFANLCHSNKIFCSAGAFLFAWNKYVCWTEAATGSVQQKKMFLNFFYKIRRKTLVSESLF